MVIIATYKRKKQLQKEEKINEDDHEMSQLQLPTSLKMYALNFDHLSTRNENQYIAGMPTSTWNDPQFSKQCLVIHQTNELDQLRNCFIDLL